MTTQAQIRAERAIETQARAVQFAIMTGDRREEIARLLAWRRLKNRQARAERTQEEFHALLDRLETSAARRGRTDWLAQLARTPANGIGDHHIRAAECLRDHMEYATSGSAEAQERVDGGRIHNGQMEAWCDRRRPLRRALDASMEAITDERLIRGFLAIVIEMHSVPKALADCGFSKSGKMHKRMVLALIEGLDAAAAHIGVAR